MNIKIEVTGLPFPKIIRQLILRYFRDGIGRSAAALSYYLIFTCFPFLLMISSLPGVFHLQPISVKIFAGLLPAEVIEIIENYLIYLAESPSAPSFMLGFFLTVWFSMRAMNCLILGIRRAHSLPLRENAPIKKQALIFVSALGLIGTVFISIIALSLSPGAIHFLAEFIPSLHFLESYWSLIRMLLLAALVFWILLSLYRLAPGGLSSKEALPGTICALIFWILVSGGYAFYVEHIGKYTLVYGAIGAVIILLLWFYLSGMIILMGAELNSLLLPHSQ